MAQARPSTRDAAHQALVAHRRWQRSAHQMKDELKEIADKLDENYKRKTCKRACMNALSVASVLIRFYSPIVSAIPMAANTYIYTRWKFDGEQCVDNLDSLAQKLESLQQLRINLNEALEPIQGNIGIPYDIHNAIDETDRAIDICRQTIVPIIEQSLLDCIPGVAAFKRAISNSLSKMFAQFSQHYGTEVLEDLVRMSDCTVENLITEIKLMFNDIRRNNGDCLEIVRNENLRRTIFDLLNAVFCSAFFKCWTDCRVVKRSILNGVQSMREVVLEFPLVSTVGFVPVVIKTGSLFGNNDVGQFFDKIYKTGSGLFVLLDICLLAYEAFSLYSAAEIMHNGCRTEISKFIREFCSMIQNEIVNLHPIEDRLHEIIQNEGN